MTQTVRHWARQATPARDAVEMNVLSGGDRMDHATHLYPVPAAFAARARVDARRYAADYARSVSEPEAFWGEIGRRLDWIRPYSKVKDVSYRLDDFHIRWYEDGTLN